MPANYRPVRTNINFDSAVRIINLLVLFVIISPVHQDNYLHAAAFSKPTFAIYAIQHLVKQNNVYMKHF